MKIKVTHNLASFSKNTVQKAMLQLLAIPSHPLLAFDLQLSTCFTSCVQGIFVCTCTCMHTHHLINTHMLIYFKEFHILSETYTLIYLTNIQRIFLQSYILQEVASFRPSFINRVKQSEFLITYYNALPLTFLKI